MKTRQRERHNLKSIIRILVVDKKIIKDYKYKVITTKYGLFGKKRKYTRRYVGAWLNPITFSAALEKFIIVKGDLYTKPYVQVFFNDGENIYNEFDTYEKALEFADKLELETKEEFKEI